MRPHYQGFLSGFPQQVTRSKSFTQEEIDEYARAYAKSGFRLPLQWYCTYRINWEQDADLPLVVQQPALMVTAGRDRALPPVLAKGMEAWVPRLRRGHVEGAAHWVQMESAERINSLLLGFLQDVHRARSSL